MVLMNPFLQGVLWIVPLWSVGPCAQQNSPCKGLGFCKVISWNKGTCIIADFFGASRHRKRHIACSVIGAITLKIQKRQVRWYLHFRKSPKGVICRHGPLLQIDKIGARKPHQTVPALTKEAVRGSMPMLLSACSQRWSCSKSITNSASRGLSHQVSS